ncbi:conserved hypothetical protein [Frankia sp. AiPs1]|uniref:hypothetical protein n=1 Tax=Frankia sp. AiPa1 TaxID=573492 RepID=UPI00202B8703|nr:hypothetical protein [Frankia sp. AiPa1]MCL9758942.1 hypothetical protein [Frankia sp. AiPa1]
MTGRHLRVFHRDYYDDAIHDGDIDTHDEWSEDLDCEPDEFDRADGLSAVDLAVTRLGDLAVTEPSGWPYPGPHCWWSGTVTLSYYAGEMRETSAHPQGFSDPECRDIWTRLTGA